MYISRACSSSIVGPEMSNIPRPVGLLLRFTCVFVLSNIGGGDQPALEYCSSSALLYLSYRLCLCTYYDNVYIMINIINQNLS